MANNPFMISSLAMWYRQKPKKCFFMQLKWRRKEVQSLHPPPTFLLDCMGVAEFRPLQVFALV